MCLAVPGKVLEITEQNGLLMGRVDFAGMVSSACLAYVPEIKVGQYVIVHAGFALSVVDEEEARKTFALLAEIRTGVRETEVGRKGESGDGVTPRPID